MSIELNSNTGTHLTEGNEEVWRKGAKREQEEDNVSIFGCWNIEENGNRDQNHEEVYSEEIWNEQKKQGMRMMQQ